MHANVVAHEPHEALFVPDNDSMVFYRALADFGEHRLYPHGIIYMEIHESLGGQVQKLFDERGYTVTLKKDMQGKERMVKAAK
jgi:release factor glutamine methyltransferase